MPSLQWLVSRSFSPDSLRIIGICNTAPASWLLNYQKLTRITFPMIADGASGLFTLYRVGTTYGKSPPTYLIIDRRGVVRYRIDDQFGRFDEMIATIRSLL